MAKNDIAVKKEHAVAVATFFEEDAQQGGFDNMNQEDFALPFLRLLTNTSPEVGEVEGAMPGMIYNTVTGQLYDGKKGITVIPCAYIRQYIEWAPRGSGSGAPITIYPATSDILSRTHREPGDNKDYLDNGNYIENTANHYVMIVGEDDVPEPALITMKSTQLKISRRWKTQIALQRIKNPKNGQMVTPAVYATMWKLTTTEESNDQGSWNNYAVEKVGLVNDRSLLLEAKAFRESVMAGDVKAAPEESIGGGAHAEDRGDIPF